jgi:hypothetical protein
MPPRRNDRKGPSSSSGQADESLMDFFNRTRASTDAEIDRDIARSCTSKQPYASEAEARAVMAMNGMKLFTYHCRYCDCWHLTRRPTSSSTPDIIDE